jgi:hypothetical protein
MGPPSLNSRGFDSSHITLDGSVCTRISGGGGGGRWAYYCQVESSLSRLTFVLFKVLMTRCLHAL